MVNLLLYPYTKKQHTSPPTLHLVSSVVYYHHLVGREQIRNPRILAAIYTNSEISNQSNTSQYGPCHAVVRRDDNITGYSSNVPSKNTKDYNLHHQKALFVKQGVSRPASTCDSRLTIDYEVSTPLLHRDFTRRAP